MIGISFAVAIGADNSGVEVKIIRAMDGDILEAMDGETIETQDA